MNRVFGRLTAAIAGGVLAISTLAVGDGSAFASENKIRLVFPTAPTTLSLPFYVAQKKKWFGDLNIEEIYVNGDSNAMRSLLSGNADIAMVGTLNVLTAVESGADVKVVHAWQPVGDYNLVIATKKGSSVADLAGKVIAGSGPGALPDQLPRMIMKKHGVSDEDIRLIQVGGHSARLQAVLGGRADATLINTVTAMRGVQSGDVKIVARVASELPGIGYVYNVVRSSLLKDPERVKQIEALTVGGIRASRFIMENPGEAAAILHERLPDLTVDYLEAVVRMLNEDKVWGVNGGIDPKITETTVALYRDLDKLKSEVKASTLIDHRFVDDALKSLGKVQGY